MAKAKEISELDCSSDALDGAVKVLRVRFEEITELHKSSDFSDVDLIHDLRVAARRLRSAMRDFIPLLQKEIFKEIKKDLKKISDALGKVRDEDVAILALEKLQTEAEAEITKAQIETFLQERKYSRKIAQSELEEILTIEKINDLQESFSAKLDETINSSQSNKIISFKEFGQTVIAQNLQEFEDLSSSLYEPFDTDKLHQLRLSAKRLRYSMKIFVGCFDEEAKYFAKKVSKMQTFLGDTHDCDEWIKNLFLPLREQNDSLDKNKREALIWLSSKFFERRNKEFTSALKLWSDWQADYFLARLKAMTL